MTASVNAVWERASFKRSRANDEFSLNDVAHAPFRAVSTLMSTTF